jgi:uncharacterized membrane protein YsdA (DUF1294 family)
MPRRWLQASTVLWLVLLASALWRGSLTPGWATTLLLLNGLTALAYWLDKRGSHLRGWRVNDDTLHLLDLLGGWPAGAWAQRRLGHKVEQPAFQITWWAALLIHWAALLGWWFGLYSRLG